MENFLLERDRGGFPDIGVVVSSNPDVRGCEVARGAGLPLVVVGRDKGYDPFPTLDAAGVDLVCLAGWLKRLSVPAGYENRIMNVHPSLLPSFGGLGCYGSRVHEMVLKRGCKVTGCTVHFVDNNYDHGPIISQGSVPVLETDDPSTLAARVFREECLAYREAVRMFASGRLRVEGSTVRVAG